MSRFDLYGGILCENCEYYRKSRLYPRMRCDHKDNTHDGRLGTVYMRQPDDINWNHKCDKFKEKE